jgi:hypothetical protein
MRKRRSTVPDIEEHKVALAQVEVDRSRSQLMSTVAELLERLEPKKIMEEVWESAKIKGADLAEDAVDAVKNRPVAVGGVLAAITMFLAREPIKDAAVKLYGAVKSPDKEPDKPAPALKPTKPKPPARRAKRTPAAPRKKVEKVS